MRPNPSLPSLLSSSAATTDQAMSATSPPLPSPPLSNSTRQLRVLHFPTQPPPLFNRSSFPACLREAARGHSIPSLPCFPSPSMAEAAAMDPGGDKLILRGLQFHGFHGVLQEEKTLGQKFVVDIDAWMDLAAAGESDSIDHTVSYTDIYGIAKDVVEGSPRNLLESVAHLIAMATLLKFPQISAVRVKVGKPHVAVQGVLDYLGVEIMRHRKRA